MAAKKKTKKKAKAKAKKTTKKKTAKKKTAKKKTAKKKTAKKKTARKANAAFMRPLTPSSVLAAIVGAKPIPRTEVTKKLWTYIKKNKLQDAMERRFINADAKLKEVFGGKSRVNMFEMTKHVAKHLS
ncbi:MAG: hypothetical protein COV44_07190 [Deltaproteobacteria bacterium CG11_big_fil_rev_8_21_14_0_20_45_16]|nr:MAG: hypothetical protein COV44_07190 [Deltaproteobacteria bacterium CG11_big_fil_rev_8_21_14_0_20_45_16]